MKRRKRGNMVQDEASCLDHNIVGPCRHIRELCPPCKSIIKHVSVRLGHIYAVAQADPNVQCITTNNKSLHPILHVCQGLLGLLYSLLVLGPRVKSDHHQDGWGMRQPGSKEDTHWLSTTLSAIDTHHLHSHFIGQSTCGSRGPGRITLPQENGEQIGFGHGWCTVERRLSGEIQREHATVTRERTGAWAVAPMMEWARRRQSREVVRMLTATVYWPLLCAKWCRWFIPLNLIFSLSLLQLSKRWSPSSKHICNSGEWIRFSHTCLRVQVRISYYLSVITQANSRTLVFISWS